MQSIALTQLLSAICILTGCEHKYPSPVEEVTSVKPTPGFVLLGASSRNSYTVVDASKFTNNNSNNEITTRIGRYEVNNNNILDTINNNDLNNEAETKTDESERENKIVVTTELGKVQGYPMKIVGGREIYAFEGIPYAQPPIGNLRFQAPIAHPGWINETLQALNPGPVCIQLAFGRLKGGGWFITGSGSRYGPTYLLRENIILVTLNYRLGIMGAFSTGDAISSGNWGMKDIALAINWVFKNIDSFGGDQDKLVLMGQSAGAVSTHLQMMSPLARDKLKAAITMSGGAYNVWGLNSLEQGVKLSIINARLARCPFNEGSSTLLKCMQSIPAQVLIANQIITYSSGILPVPMLEPNVVGAFLSESPDDAYRNQHVAPIPLISTITSEEINAFIAQLTARGEIGIRILNGIFDLDASTVLSLRGRIPRSRERRIVSKIRRYYGRPLRLSIPREFFSQVGSARYFTAPFHKGVQMHSQIGPTYAGIFNYTNNPFGKPIRLGLDPKEYGVTHTDDLIFIFNSTNKPSLGKNDYGFALTKLLTNIYANFGRTGSPYFTAEDGNSYKFWEVVKDPNNYKVLQIDEEVKMMDNPYAKSTKFWESLDIKDITPFIPLNNIKS